jgi:hypothetical protein
MKTEKEENEAASRRLRIASKDGDADALRVAIEEGGDVNSFQEGDEIVNFAAHWPLHLAIDPDCGNSEECAGLLIGAGADVDLATADGWTILMQACSNDWPLEIMSLLLRAGANANHQNTRRWTVLFIASGKRLVEHIRILIEYGANPNLADENGSTALIKATSDCQTMRVLIENAALVNATDRLGETALFYCTTLAAVELLLQSGANPRICNVCGKTAFQQYHHLLADASRCLFENWTPFQLLPPWNPSAFSLYIDHCLGFAGATKMTLLVLLRQRQFISRNVGMKIIAFVAESHREEQWWPIESFDAHQYM